MQIFIYLILSYLIVNSFKCDDSDNIEDLDHIKVCSIFEYFPLRSRFCQFDDLTILGKAIQKYPHRSLNDMIKQAIQLKRGLRHRIKKDLWSEIDKKYGYRLTAYCCAVGCPAIIYALSCIDIENLIKKLESGAYKTMK